MPSGLVGLRKVERDVQPVFGAHGQTLQARKDQGSASLCVRTNVRISQRIRTDGKFGAMMDVSLTNEVRDEHRRSGRDGFL